MCMNVYESYFAIANHFQNESPYGQVASTFQVYDTDVKLNVVSIH